MPFYTHPVHGPHQGDQIGGAESREITEAEFWEMCAAREVLPAIADLAMEKLAAINDGKNVALDAGFMHNGTLYDSDIKARLAYLEVEKKLREDPGYSTGWKALRGQWVTMDAALFTALQPTYETHISACFAWQAAREQEVAAALALAVEDEAAGRAALEAVGEVMS